MVRFIILIISGLNITTKKIYIPIWLDLLFKDVNSSNASYDNLHSNMVRFIIYKSFSKVYVRFSFTFQYG